MAPVGSPLPFLQKDLQVETVIESSGIEPLGNGTHILVVHDKSPGLRVFDRESGQTVGNPLTCPAFPEGLAVGPKWEGLAHDSHGGYYVIGSHSGKDDNERTQRAYLFRFQVVGDGSTERPWAIQADSVRRWHIADSLLKNLTTTGLATDRIDRRKIEGLAVRETYDPAGKVQDRYLAIGLREPDELVRVFEVNISSLPEPESQLDLRPAFTFAAGRSPDGQENMQLTSLERVNEGTNRGYFVVTASEDAENVFHGNRLWFVPDQQLADTKAGVSVTPELVWTFEASQKAEGFAILNSGPDHALTAIVVFDNDAHKTRTPSRFQRLTLKHRTRTP